MQCFSKRHLVNETKRSMLLNLPSMKYDPGNMKQRVLSNLDQTQLGGIEALQHFVQGQSYRLIASCFSSSTDTQAGMRPRQPHEVPVRIPHLCIECGGSRAFDGHPSLAEWHLDKG